MRCLGRHVDLLSNGLKFQPQCSCNNLRKSYTAMLQCWNFWLPFLHSRSSILMFLEHKVPNKTWYKCGQSLQYNASGRPWGVTNQKKGCNVSQKLKTVCLGVRTWWTWCDYMAWRCLDADLGCLDCAKTERNSLLRNFEKDSARKWQSQPWIDNAYHNLTTAQTCTNSFHSTQCDWRPPQSMKLYVSYIEPRTHEEKMPTFAATLVCVAVLVKPSAKLSESTCWQRYRLIKPLPSSQFIVWGDASFTKLNCWSFREFTLAATGHHLKRHQVGSSRLSKKIKWPCLPTFNGI